MVLPQTLWILGLLGWGGPWVQRRLGGGQGPLPLEPSLVLLQLPWLSPPHAS